MLSTLHLECLFYCGKKGFEIITGVNYFRVLRYFNKLRISSFLRISFIGGMGLNLDSDLISLIATFMVLPSPLRRE